MKVKSFLETFQVVKLFNVIIFSVFVSAILFVCVEVPWAHVEKFIFTNILGIGTKPKKT
jgi:hypothetical protein